MKELGKSRKFDWVKKFNATRNTYHEKTGQQAFTPDCEIQKQCHSPQYLELTTPLL
jgi:hypothetical protein